LRHAVHRIGLPMPGASHLTTIVGDLLTAKEDAQPLIRWRGAEARRYRDQLYLLPASDTDVAAPDEQLVAGDRVNLRVGHGALTLAPGAPVGLSDGVVADGLRLQYRHGGEEIQPIGHAHTRKLKKLLQEEGIVPWMRDRLPLLYAGQRLVAVADLWIAAEAASEPGNAVVWEQRPPIH
jgi:tRNA(Ile)-lysidine synthase